MNLRTYLYFAFKIKDGLFIGDINSPSEKDFLISNKITTVINCASSQIKPIQLNIGLKFMNFNWQDSDEQIILDDQDNNINQIFEFMNTSYENCESILVCSLRGQSRALTIITAFLMRKFNWSLYKTLEYMNSKRSDFEIRATFLRQLLNYEQRIFGLGNEQTCSKTWQDDKNQDNEAILVKNTFLNAQSSIFNTDVINQDQQQLNVKQNQRKLKWSKIIEIEIDGSIQHDYKQELQPQKSILKLQQHVYQEDNKTNPENLSMQVEEPTIKLDTLNNNSSLMQQKSDTEPQINQKLLTTDDQEFTKFDDPNLIKFVEINKTEPDQGQSINLQINGQSPQNKPAIKILKNRQNQQLQQFQPSSSHQFQQYLVPSKRLQTNSINESNRIVTPTRQLRKNSMPQPTPPPYQKRHNYQKKQNMPIQTPPNEIIREDLNENYLESGNKYLNQPLLPHQPSTIGNSQNQFQININFNINSITEPIENIKTNENSPKNQRVSSNLRKQQKTEPIVIKNGQANKKLETSPYSFLPSLRDSYNIQQNSFKGKQTPQPPRYQRIVYTENNSPENGRERFESQHLKKIPKNNYIQNSQMDTFLNEDLQINSQQQQQQFNLQQHQYTQNANPNIQKIQQLSATQQVKIPQQKKNNYKQYREMTPSIQRNNNNMSQQQQNLYNNSNLLQVQNTSTFANNNYQNSNNQNNITTQNNLQSTDQNKTDFSFFKVNNRKHFINFDKKRAHIEQNSNPNNANINQITSNDIISSNNNNINNIQVTSINNTNKTSSLIMYKTSRRALSNIPNSARNQTPLQQKIQNRKTTNQKN